MKFTTDPLMKFVPVTARVKAPLPAVKLAGWSAVTVGTGLGVGAMMVKLIAPDVPPFDGFVTVTGTVPAVVTADAGMAAVSCVALTKAVVAAPPLKLTADPLTKFVPVTVSVKAEDPATIVAGCRTVTVGGFAPGAVMVKFTEFDVPPPEGFVTVTGTVP